MTAEAARLEPLDFDALAGFGDDDHLAAFRCFERSAGALAEGGAGARPARKASGALVAAARAALSSKVTDAADARRFFETRFRPFRVVPDPPGFLTGYYEPCIAGSLVETDGFRWPILARPADLVTFAPGEAPTGFPEGVSGARLRSDGAFVPYDDREAIERERRQPIVWLSDAVEAFLVQVQGSAQVEFPDGRRARLAYDGRNGLPYASIGRILIETGEIGEGAMSLASLKAWLRAAELGEGERGLALLRQNRSFVFFQLVEDFDPELGPVAGAGVALISVALDRRRSDALELRPAVLDRGEPALGGRGAAAVPSPLDRAGHRLGDCRTGSRRHILWQRRRGGRARRRNSPSRRVHCAHAPRRRAVKQAPPHRLRRLSDEEIALWTEVARSVSRRRGASLPAPSKPSVPRSPAAPPSAPAARAEAKAAKPPALPLAPIERRLKRALARGRGAIDAALDLHGMNQAEAHQALRGFLRHSQARGARLVIVVTGKGGPLDEPAPLGQERGVLRRLAPTGCASPTCARWCSASRRRNTPTADRGRSTCGCGGGDAASKTRRQGNPSPRRRFQGLRRQKLQLLRVRRVVAARHSRSGPDQRPRDKKRRSPDLVGPSRPSPYHFRARIQSFQRIAAPCPGFRAAPLQAVPPRDPDD